MEICSVRLAVRQLDGNGMVAWDASQNLNIASRVDDANLGGVKYRPEGGSYHGHCLSNKPLEHLAGAVDDSLSLGADDGSPFWSRLRH